MPENSLPPSASLLRWFWRDDARPADVRHAALRLRACGYGGLVLWPEAPWNFDDELFRQRAQAVAGACREIGLELWLRDDWTAPSGAGLLSTNATRAEYGASALRFAEEAVPRGTSWPRPEGAPLAAWAVPCGGGAPRFAELLNLLPAWSENPARLVASLGEDALALTFWSEPWPGDLDRLHPGSAQLLLETVHENWRALLGEFFGSTLRGFWTLGPPLPQNAPDVLPWSPRLPEAFLEDHGYDLIAQLAALIAPTGDEAAGVRQDFWTTVAQLLEKNWWRPQRSWCERHGVELVTFPGPDGEENFKHSVAAHADPVAGLRAGHRTAVAAESTQLWSRLAASVAALEGAPPPLAVWANETPQERAPQLLKLWQHGVGAALTPRGEEQQPFVALTGHDAEANAAALLAATQPGARVGVMLATRSAWAHYHSKGHRFLRWVWDDYLGAARLLDELHYDFLLLPEDDFLAAKSAGPQLLCGRAELPLDLIVLPGATALHHDAWSKLETFVADGGKVICLGLLPRWSERGRDVDLEERIEKATLLTVADLYSEPGTIADADESSAGFPITKENERGGRLSCYQPSSNADRADARLRVRQMLKDSLPASCETQSPHVRFARRTSGAGELFLLANLGPTRFSMLRLRASREGEGVMREWILPTGAARDFPVWSRFSSDEGGGFGVELACAAGDMRWLEFQPGDDTPHLEKATLTVDAFDGHMATGYATHNHLPRVTRRRGARYRSFFAREAVTIPPPLMLSDEWQATRRSANIQRVQEWHRPPSELGARFALRGTFRVENFGGPLHVFAALGVDTLFCNNARLAPETSGFADESPFSSLHGNWFVVPQLTAGENVLDCAWTDDGTPEILLAGEFGFAEDGALTAPGALTLGSGSWHEQGLPLYCGAVDYAQEFQAPASWANCRVWLELSNLREAASVLMNRENCGVLSAPPWKFEVTGALRPGEKNTLCLTIANTLAPLESSQEPPPAGLLGPVRLVAYPVVEISTEKQS